MFSIWAPFTGQMECQSSSGTQMPSPRWGPRCFLVMQLCCSSPTLGALGIFCPFTPPHPLAPFQIPWLLAISSAPQVRLFRLTLLSTFISPRWISLSFERDSFHLLFSLSLCTSHGFLILSSPQFLYEKGLYKNYEGREGGWFLYLIIKKHIISKYYIQ